MKIAILTMPLTDSYGGILQNYALQCVLKEMHHDPITLYYAPQVKPLYLLFLSWIKTIICRCLRKKSSFAKLRHYQKSSSLITSFIETEILKTSYQKNFYKTYKKAFYDAIIVGSDQVWRPKYNYSIKNMFLNFCKKEKGIKRIAYAASFGVDEWEYSPKQTKVCSTLVKEFDAISVREKSGVRLCKKNLGVEATWVLDPTLLLTKEDYCGVCKEIPLVKEKILVAYILDKSENILLQCESIAAERGLTLKFFEAGKNASLTVPEWLAMFRDASYVVTDSFHGTVFSIIFGKEFKCLYNNARGSARFDSLLELYESGKLNEMRDFSFNWLKKAL